MTFSHPDSKDGALYLTEGGYETELMHLHGFELTCFAAFHRDQLCSAAHT